MIDLMHCLYMYFIISIKIQYFSRLTYIHTKGRISVCLVTILADISTFTTCIVIRHVGDLTSP